MSRLSFASTALIILGAVSSLNAAYLHANKPLKNRYIVTLDDSVTANEVDRLSKVLAHEFQGHIIATMSHGMKGFGIVMTDERARALSHNHLVTLVEEDGEIEIRTLALRSSSRRQRRLLLVRLDIFSRDRSLTIALGPGRTSTVYTVTTRSGTSTFLTTRGPSTPPNTTPTTLRERASEHISWIPASMGSTLNFTTPAATAALKLEQT